MTQVQTNEEKIDGKSEDVKFSVMDFMIVLAKRKKLIFFSTMLMAMISVAISFAIPEVYKSTARLLPPQQAQSGTAALLSQLGGVAGIAAGAAGIKSPNDLYIGMLKSRTVGDRLIAKYDLKKNYNVSSQEKARKELEENTLISSGKDGLIVIEVEDTNKKLVADIANGYVAELTKLTQVLALTEASKQRIFFERQLEITKNNLADAEIALKRSIDKNGVVSVDGDSRAIVEIISKLRAQISAKEIQLGSMQSYVTANNPEYIQIKEELRNLRIGLAKLETGNSPGATKDEKNGSEEIGLKSIKILRDVKYNQMLYELLAKQYEAARLDEAKESAIIQVLDAAVEPEKKIKPRRLIIVLLSTLAALFLSIVIALILEAKRRVMQLPEGLMQWNELKNSLKF
ncbi:Wzz/FepE/Etk N-terminal domain-containing protein [Janthinobacterium sp. SUN128]|uniref:GumC family protein n=1 Tax=Janthinobacterium sp. SUN128 TaxID=3014790 RepID=UPI0027139C30|nr:GNVR domain-containing protein [Janthinobacterium sp. SUN128]MDO8035564.1 Wzz/FepE/Etk N-terminal domain-containing protein [Janthinobacterium sp. SUN128]